MTTESSRPHPGLTVRPLEASDVAFAADLHGLCLPDGFFARLGVPFLNTYYGCFVRSPWAICLIAEVDRRPTGIVVGTVDSWQHYRFLVRRCGWRLGLSGGIALLARPRLAPWFLRSRGRRYARGLVRLVRRRPPRPATVGDTPTPTAGSPGAEGLLVHIAIAPHLRRSGAGGALVTAFRDEARTRGVQRVRLLAAAGDDGARCFYEKLGWDRGGDVVDADGKRWSRFVRDA